jgi:multiple sugar transport system substrate-binding protein
MPKGPGGQFSYHVPFAGRFAGYAGPAGRKAAEVISKYLISDMYAKAVQGMPVEQAVKSTRDELVKIYA